MEESQKVFQSEPCPKCDEPMILYCRTHGLYWGCHCDTVVIKVVKE